jgi:site-specific recombinase XerD
MAFTIGNNLRHWYTTELFRAARDLRATQRLMRHRSSSATDRYAYVADPAEVESVSMLPRITSS